MYSTCSNPNCGTRLIRIGINAKYYYIACDNLSCPLYRERQGLRKKEPKPKPSRTVWPGYQEGLRKKKENYALLRSLKVPCRQAAKDCSGMRTREIVEEMQKELVLA